MSGTGRARLKGSRPPAATSRKTDAEELRKRPLPTIEESPSEVSDVKSDTELVAGSRYRSRSHQKRPPAKRQKRQGSDDSDVDADAGHTGSSRKKRPSKKRDRQESDSDSDSDSDALSESWPSTSDSAPSTVSDDSSSSSSERSKKKKKKAMKKDKKGREMEKGGRKERQRKKKHRERERREEERKKKKKEELPSRIAGGWLAEERRMGKRIAAAKVFVKESFPAVTRASFRQLAPRRSTDGEFTPDEYDAAKAKWMVDPLRPLLLGQHKGDRSKGDSQLRVLEAFLGPYRMLLRYYHCLYEDFMGPRFQLRYDNSHNSLVPLGDDMGDTDGGGGSDGSNQRKQLVRDPFPSRAFSEALMCLLSQPIWLGQLERLATCLQFVNILRTQDTRPWNLVDCDPESRFFGAWQHEVRSNPRGEKPIEELFARVKSRVGNTGLYCALFDQIIHSVWAKRRASDNHVSKRKRDDDPYFIHVVDLSMLKSALDDMENFGFPLFRGPSFTELAVKFSRPDQDYPRSKEFSEARDREIIYIRMMRAKAEADDEADDGAEDEDGRRQTPWPRQGSDQDDPHDSSHDSSDNDSDGGRDVVGNDDDIRHSDNDADSAGDAGDAGDADDAGDVGDADGSDGFDGDGGDVPPQSPARSHAPEKKCSVSRHESNSTDYSSAVPNERDKKIEGPPPPRRADRPAGSPAMSGANMPRRSYSPWPPHTSSTKSVEEIYGQKKRRNDFM